MMTIGHRPRVLHDLLHRDLHCPSIALGSQLGLWPERTVSVWSRRHICKPKVTPGFIRLKPQAIRQERGGVAICLDPRQLAELGAVATAQGAPLGAVLRTAVYVKLNPNVETPRRARGFRRLLTAPLMTKAGTRVTIRLAQAEAQELGQYCREEGVTLSEALRESFYEWIGIGSLDESVPDDFERGERL